ncbi:MAG: hypothetical protein ACXABY_29690 [Candidatus Thorarchaeota archaeon]|jgi:hypothetical protein
MLGEFITIVTRDGFWSSDTRTFRRSDVKVTQPFDDEFVSCSACCPRGRMTQVELDTGEIIIGPEYPHG